MAQNNKGKKYIFIVGSKGIPAAYGGFETFVDKLTEYHKDLERIQYVVACKANGEGSIDPNTNPECKILADDMFMYHNALCFRVKVPEWLGSAQAIYYDVVALEWCIRFAIKKGIDNPIFYVLACRIGPFFAMFRKKIHKIAGILMLNPDGHEWKRGKWSKPVKMYWKMSEKQMVRNADYVVCDSINIEKYIHEQYDTKKKKINTDYIAYGAETDRNISDESKVRFNKWLADNKLTEYGYYLVVGRLVPENNFDTILQEFATSGTEKKLVIVTSYNRKYYEELNKKYSISTNERIKFCYPIYDQDLLYMIRKKAYAYIHGHEVGGTNPSLLEALATTRLNLLLDVEFNREVGGDTVIYWAKEQGCLMDRINRSDNLTTTEIDSHANEALNRVKVEYNWKKICEAYYYFFNI